MRGPEETGVGEVLMATPVRAVRESGAPRREESGSPETKAMIKTGFLRQEDGKVGRLREGVTTLWKSELKAPGGAAGTGF